MVKYSLVYSGREPEFSDGDIFHVFIPVVFADAKQAASEHAPRLSGDARDSGEPRSEPLDDIDAVILQEAARCGYVTANSIAQTTGKTTRTARRHLSRLVERGLLKPQGQSHNRQSQRT